MGFLLTTVVKYLATIYRRAKHPEESFLILQPTRHFKEIIQLVGLSLNESLSPHSLYGYIKITQCSGAVLALFK
jgi:hypothetical protein